MAIERTGNWLNQQRVDVPHLRALESSVAADFDALAGRVLTSHPLVVTGLTLVTTGAVGSPATSLQLLTASGVILHPTASEHGTVFTFADDLSAEILNGVNSRVVGGFSPSAVNYIGLDLIRYADAATTDSVAFLDADTKLEVTKSVPLARTPQYRIVIGTRDFESQPNLLPIAKVTTSASNTVSSIEDVRPMLGRLASGGSGPDVFGSYPWPQGRAEQLTLVGSDYTSQTFVGGDKAFATTKDWMDGVMTRLWEIGGGSFWYSPTSDRELKLVCSSSVLGSGDNFSWVAGVLKWKGLAISFGNSTVYSNTIADNDTTGVALTSGQCLYVDLDRNSNLVALTAQVGDLTTLGQSTTPGQRVVIAWCIGTDVLIRDRPYEVGREYLKATDVAYGVVRLKVAAPTPSDPVVVAIDASGSLTNTGVGGGSGINGTGGSSIGSKGVNGTGGVNGGFGGYFTGVLGYAGSVNQGGGSTSLTGGTGVVGIGGVATSALNHGGYGGLFTGANHATGAAGHGVSANGGNATGGTSAGGTGGYFVGGTSAGGTAGHGVYGEASGTGGYGGYFTHIGGGTAAKFVSSGTPPGVIIDASAGSGIGATITGNAGDCALYLANVASQAITYMEGGGGGAPSLQVVSLANTYPALWLSTTGTKDKAIAKLYGYIDLTGAVAPSVSTAFGAVQTPANMIRSAGFIITNATTSPTVVGGFNVSTVAASGGAIVVTMGSALAGWYAVKAQITKSTGEAVPCGVLHLSSTQFQIQAQGQISAGVLSAAPNLETTSNYYVEFQVVGA